MLIKWESSKTNTFGHGEIKQKVPDHKKGLYTMRDSTTHFILHNILEMSVPTQSILMT